MRRYSSLFTLQTNIYNSTDKYICDDTRADTTDDADTTYMIEIYIKLNTPEGKTATTLNPLDNATRAEIAAILHSFLEANK